MHTREIWKRYLGPTEFHPNGGVETLYVFDGKVTQIELLWGDGTTLSRRAWHVLSLDYVGFPLETILARGTPEEYSDWEYDGGW